jgi:hypothetical protein
VIAAILIIGADGGAIANDESSNMVAKAKIDIPKASHPQNDLILQNIPELTMADRVEQVPKENQNRNLSPLLIFTFGLLVMVLVRKKI